MKRKFNSEAVYLVHPLFTEACAAFHSILWLCTTPKCSSHTDFQLRKWAALCEIMRKRHLSWWNEDTTPLFVMQGRAAPIGGQPASPHQPPDCPMRLTLHQHLALGRLCESVERLLKQHWPPKCIKCFCGESHQGQAGVKGGMVWGPKGNLNGNHWAASCVSAAAMLHSASPNLTFYHICVIVQQRARCVPQQRCELKMSLTLPWVYLLCRVLHNKTHFQCNRSIKGKTTTVIDMHRRSSSVN